MAPLAAMLPALGLGTAAAGTAAVGGTIAELGALSTIPALSGAASAAMGAVGAGAAGGGWLGSMLTGASILGLGAKMIGGITSANDTADIMNANAETARRQAIAEQNAGKGESLKLSKEKRQIAGEQTAAFGASGVDLSSGTPLDVMAQTAGNVERDIIQTGINADTKASGLRYQANIYDWAAQKKRMAGWLGAGTDLLSGVGAIGMAKGWGV